MPILPNYESMQIQELVASIKEVLNSNREDVERLLSTQAPLAWEDRCYPLELLQFRLDTLWNTLSHLNHVKNTSEIYAAYQEVLPLISNYHTDLMHNQKLYQWISAYAESEEYLKIDYVKKKIVKNWLRDFILSGIELSKEDQRKIKELEIALSELESQFEQNVLISTQENKVHFTDENHLTGLPQRDLDKSKEKAKKENLSGWLITLDFPTYYTAMTHLTNSVAREKLYKAYTTRASSLSVLKKHDNGQIMLEILRKREKLSRLLGCQNYAEYVLKTRMVETPEEVENFLMMLIDKLKDKAKKEFGELEEFAEQKLNAWDVAYFSEKLAEKEFGLSQEKLRKYFPLSRVMDGLFSIVNKLFKITIREKKHFQKWDNEVVLYEVTDKNNELRGCFYIDLFARETKQSGAWVAQGSDRLKMPDELHCPVVYVCANFSDITEAGERLLTHDDVVTLFHEFGHCLHYVLTLVDFPSISGGNGVEWDGIECPSQLLENWCWQEESLQMMSRDVKTGAPLPIEKIKELKRYKFFQVGLDWIRQLEFALFDLKIHTRKVEDSGEYLLATLNDIRKEHTEIFKTPEYNRFPNTFSHIFGGGYASGYYSYLWAQVLSSDIFDSFLESGNIFNQEIANRFMNTFLEQGGSKKCIDLFIEFRGRKPKIDGLLKNAGLLT